MRAHSTAAQYIARALRALRACLAIACKLCELSNVNGVVHRVDVMSVCCAHHRLRHHGCILSCLLQGHLGVQIDHKREVAATAYSSRTSLALAYSPRWIV
eukprot:13410-Heterococcus_DN1.PRE.1